MTKNSLLNDHDRLGNTVVIIDVYRSSNTVIALLERGAELIIPVAELSEAEKLKQNYPDWLFLAERDGVIVEGADGDNSPTQDTDVSGRTIILTTSAGTRCIAACDDTKNVFVGSFANANALLHLVSNLPNSDVSFWAAGVRGEVVANEDEICANYLNEAHLGAPIVSFQEIQEQLLNSLGATRLKKRGQTEDLSYCTELDKSVVVPFRSRSVEGRWCLKRKKTDV